MKEIKFRAWDEEEKKMIEWNDTFFSDMSPVTRYSGYFSYIEMPLMQYSGLEDKNGVGVYEKDIIKTDFGFGVKGNFLVGSLLEFGGEVANHYLTSEDMEVVGNIYTNPELHYEKK